MNSKWDQAFVGDDLGLLDDVVDVEEPEGDEKDEDEETDESPVDPDPGQRGSTCPDEDGPGTDDEGEQLEGHRDEGTVAFNATHQLKQNNFC